MTAMGRILKDYRDTGAFHALVSVESAVSEGIFATKSGDLFMFLAVSGPEGECLDPAEQDHLTRQFESALRSFDERFRIYQYLMKRAGPPLPSEPSGHPVFEEARKG